MFENQHIFLKCCNVLLQASRHSGLKDEIYWCPETVSICTVYVISKKKNKIENELIRPKELKYNATGRYMYSKNIFTIARSQNCNEINQYSSIWPDGAVPEKEMKYLLALLHCNLMTNWHPSDIFIELPLI